jgi:hypothetical protein
VRYGPNDVQNVVDSNNGSKSRSPRNRRSTTPVKQVRADSKLKKPNFLDRYLKLRENGKEKKIFEKCKRQFKVAYVKNETIKNNSSENILSPKDITSN